MENTALKPMSESQAQTHEHEKEHAPEKQNSNPPASQTQQDNSESNMHHEVKTLMEWQAPGRPFRQRGKTYYATVLLIMLFIEIILFLFSQYMLMLVVVSFVFVAFALAIVPPHNLYYRISTEGILLEDTYVLWKELYDFYFTRSNGHDILHLRTDLVFPGEFLVTLGNVTVDQVKHALLPYLPFREYIKPTFTEKAGDWLERNFPMEAISSSDKSKLTPPSQQ